MLVVVGTGIRIVSCPAAWSAGSVPVVAGVSGDPRFPATIVAEIGGRPVRLAPTGPALRTKYLLRV